MKKYEYNIVYVRDSEIHTKLNSLGKEGWELIDVKHEAATDSFFNGHTLARTVCIVRRELLE